MKNQLAEKDVEILDGILKMLLEKGDISPEELPPLSNHYFSDIKEFIEIDYKYYFEILEKFEIVEFLRLSGGIGRIKSIRNKTDSFYCAGGFSKIYQEQQRKISNKREFEELGLKKLRWDIMASRFQAKTRWWPLIISAISLIIAIIALFKK
jgi:hypothetical protein